MKQSYLYIIKCGDYYKIGKADIVRKRLTELQIGNPFPLELVRSYKIIACMVERLEKNVHEVLWRRRVRGEWFTMSADVLEVIDHHLGAAERASAPYL